MNKTAIASAALKNRSETGTGFETESSEWVCERCRRPKPRNAQGDLTARERDVVGLIRFGKLNKEIAHELCLSEGTVKEYLNRIFRKLNVKNRTELAIWALQHDVAV